MKIPISSEISNKKEVKNTNTRQSDQTEEKGTNMENGTLDPNEVNFPIYKKISDYLLGSCIGEGSFAKVRVGYHRPTKEKVAVKVINKAKAQRDSYVYKNLHREGRLLQMLRHPNIIQIFDILETENNYYLITELCSGGELIDIVTEAGSLPEETVCKYTKQLVDAVVFMHERRIVHRDLKVENLLLDSKDNLKIIDFGLSNILPDSKSDHSCSLATQCGSPAYAAPELLAKKSYGPKVDVWSIGVITYALLVGKLPFTVDPFNIPKLCKKMIRGEMNPIPSGLTSLCRTFICKLLTPNHVTRPTIHEAAKLKWLTLYGRKRFISKNLNSTYNNLLEQEENARRRRNQLTPLANGIIDPSVVSEMSSSFGFSSTEVIRNVQKNRPGSALATYHLLFKKKLWEKMAGPSPTPDRKAVVTATNKSQTKQKAEKLQVPRKSLSSSERSRTTSPDQKTVSPQLNNAAATSNRNFQQLPKKEETITDKTKPSIKTTTKTSKVEKTLNHPLEAAVSPAPELQPIVFRSDRHSIDDNISLQFRRYSKEQEKKNNFKSNSTRKYSSSNTKPSVSSLPSESAASNVNEFINSMRKARQALKKKQQLNQEKKRLNLAIYDVNSKKAERKTSLGNLAFQTTPKKVNPHPKSSTDVETSQKNPSDENFTYFKKQASHNSHLTDTTGNTRLLNRPVQISGSPKLLRHTTDGNFKTEQTKTGTQIIKANQISPGTLPRLITKSEGERNSPSKPIENTHKIPRVIRHSFPSTQPQINRADSPAHTLNSEPVHEKTRKSVDTKAMTSNKWQSPYKQSFSSPKSHYAYHYTSHLPNHATSRPRPKKVISEPIAAAISYLTSTRDKTFNEEKSASVATS